MPERWAWCRIKHIGNVVGGGTPKTNIVGYWDGNIPWISPADLSGYTDMYISCGSRKITESGLCRSSAQLLPKGTVLYSSRAPIGYIAIAQNAIATNQGFKSVVPYTGVISEYIYYCLMARKDNIIMRATGTTFKEISGSQMKETLIPIPPFLEQREISNFVLQIFKNLTYISNERNKLINIIKLTKSKILDLAICGQLVSQNPDDEPVSVLLERIRAEKEELIKQGKIKRDKKESIIFKGDDNSYFEKIDGDVRCIDQELPFEIPYSWMFVRLKHIGSIVGGGTPKTTIPQYWNGDIPWLTPADFSGYEEIYISHGERNITMAGLNSSSAQLLPVNTVLYSSRAPIGYVAIASNDITTNQGFKSIIPIDTNMSIYIYFTLKARTDNIIMRATGTTFKEISGYEMGETFIPLPPLNEQKRIYEKILQLSNFILIIEKSLS